MFWAINATTQERLNSIDLEINPSYQFIQEEKWYAYPPEINNTQQELKEKNIDINQIEVTYVKSADYYNWNGTQIHRLPSFRILPKWKKLGINIIPESIEHKRAKVWIYNRIKNDDLILKFSTINKPWKYDNQTKISELPKDLSLLEFEVSEKTQNIRRIADILLPFHIKHPLFGSGIVFEIQFSKQYDTTKEDRTFDHALNGYSVVWIENKDIKFLKDEIFLLNSDTLQVDSWANILERGTSKQIKNAKIEVNNLSRQMDIGRNEIQEVLKKVQFERENSNKEVSSQINNLQNNCASWLSQVREEFDKKLNFPIEDVRKRISDEIFTADTIKGIMNQIMSQIEQRSNKNLFESQEWLKKQMVIAAYLSQPRSCPECGMNMELRYGQYGKFWGCSNYPDCKKIVNIPAEIKDKI